MSELLSIINIIFENKGLPQLLSISEKTNLRTDLAFSSLDLAEFTVRVEEKFGIDVFADGIVETIAEVMEKIKR
jgi:acyl carrier protein